MAYNKKVHLRQNIDAIKLAFIFEKENRKSTLEERKILSQYSGFGGIKTILNKAEKQDDIHQWKKSETELFHLVQELHEILREKSSTPDEYKQYFSSLRASVLTSFYTPKPIIDVISNVLHENKITANRILEPSAGVGAFVESFKKDFPESEIHCFEKDLITGKILSHLYPDEKVRIEGFEKIENRYHGHFDCIVSNIPFGDVAVFDPQLSNHENPAIQQSTKAIHNYFFAKSIQTAREGGLIAFITSQGVLNSENNRPIREYLMQNCNVVSAIRLPNNLFSDHAGTEVGSDLIILQKNTQNEELNQRQKMFIGTRKLSNGVSVNNLMQDFHRVIHTKVTVDTNPYGQPAIVFTHEGGIEEISNELRKMLKEDLSQHLTVEHYLRYSSNIHAEFIQNQPTTEVKSSKPIQQEPPVITLYDLFGFSQEEQKQAFKPKHKKKAKIEAKPAAELPFMEWREELAYNTFQEKLRKEQEAQRQKAIYPAKDTKQTEYQ